MNCQSAIDKMSHEDLVRRFEVDIKFDCHSFWIKISRSPHQKELLKRGKKVLSHIAERLRSIASTETEMILAWCFLLCQIQSNIDPGQNKPHLLSDKEGWVQWTTKMSPK